MKKFIFFFFFLIFISLDSLYSQMLDDEPKLIVRDSLSKDKYYVRTYFDKKGKNIQSEGLEINGLKDSIWVNYYKNGVLRIKYEYDNGFIVNLLEQYTYDNEEIFSKIFYNEFNHMIFYNDKNNVFLEIIRFPSVTIEKHYISNRLHKVQTSTDTLLTVLILNRKGIVIQKKEYSMISSNGNLMKYSFCKKSFYTDKGELVFIYYYDENGKKIKEEYFNGEKLIETIQIVN